MNVHFLVGGLFLGIVLLFVVVSEVVVPSLDGITIVSLLNRIQVLHYLVKDFSLISLFLELLIWHDTVMWSFLMYISLDADSSYKIRFLHLIYIKTEDIQNMLCKSHWFCLMFIGQYSSRGNASLFKFENNRPICIIWPLIVC